MGYGEKGKGKGKGKEVREGEGEEVKVEWIDEWILVSKELRMGSVSQ